jgi:hypothetical protein
MQSLSDDELQRRILSAAVFACWNPDQKETVLRTLKKAGRTVAFASDSPEDAAMMRQADIGMTFDDAPELARQSSGLIFPSGGIGDLFRCWRNRPARGMPQECGCGICSREEFRLHVPSLSGLRLGLGLRYRLCKR